MMTMMTQWTLMVWMIWTNHATLNPHSNVWRILPNTVSPYHNAIGHNRH
jgi:hypothetical protein